MMFEGNIKKKHSVSACLIFDVYNNFLLVTYVDKKY